MKSSPDTDVKNARFCFGDLVPTVLAHYAANDGTTLSALSDDTDECQSKSSVNPSAARKIFTESSCSPTHEISMHIISSAKMQQDLQGSNRKPLANYKCSPLSPLFPKSEDPNRLNCKNNNFVGNIKRCVNIQEVPTHHGTPSTFRYSTTSDCRNKLSVNYPLAHEKSSKQPFFFKQETLTPKASSVKTQQDTSARRKKVLPIHDFSATSFLSSTSEDPSTLNMKTKNFVVNIGRNNWASEYHRAPLLKEIHSNMHVDHCYDDEAHRKNLQKLSSSTSTTFINNHNHKLHAQPDIIQLNSTFFPPTIIDIDAHMGKHHRSKYPHSLHTCAKRNSPVVAPDDYRGSLKNNEEHIMNPPKGNKKSRQLLECKSEIDYDLESSSAAKALANALSISLNYDADKIGSEYILHDTPKLKLQRDKWSDFNSKDISPSDEVNGTGKSDAETNDSVSTSCSEMSSFKILSKLDFSNEKNDRDTDSNGSVPVSLALLEDKMWLTERECFLRKTCLEIFIASAEDVAGACNGKSASVKVGQVGIRCRFCSESIKSGGQGGGACDYPTLISRLFKSMANLQVHFKTCGKVPKDIKAKYYTSGRKRVMGAFEYRIFAAKKIGLVDINSGGIRFKSTPLPSNPSSSIIISSKERLQKSEQIAIVRPGDKPLVSGFLYTLFEQMQRCAFTEADRRGRRKKHELGFLGLGCIHCAQSECGGKYFPSTPKALATPRTVEVIFEHMQRCVSCPEDIKNNLKYIKSYMSEDVYLRRGAKQEFFNRLWIRVHDEIKDGHTSLNRSKRQS